MPLRPVVVSLGPEGVSGDNRTRKYVVMYAEYGGFVTLVAQANKVRCSDEALQSVAAELAMLCYGFEGSESIEYQEARPGDWIQAQAPGMEVPAPIDLYIDESLRDLGVFDNVQNVLAGESNDGRVFNPDLPRLLAMMETGVVDQEAFEQSIVQVLQCTKGEQVLVQRMSAKYRKEEECAEIDASSFSDHCAVTIRADCVVGSDAVSEKLRHLNVVARAHRREDGREEARFDHIVKHVLFAGISKEEVSSQDLVYAKKKRISIVPLEALKDVVISVAEGISMKGLAVRFTPPMPEMSALSP